MADRPLVQAMSSRVNLDEVFGNVCENAIREPISPYKIVVCELINTFNEMDTDSSIYTHEEALQLNSLIYGLTQHEPMPFEDVLRCVRFFDHTVRKEAGIYKYFMKRIEKVENDGHMMSFAFTATESKRTAETNAKYLTYKSPILVWSKKVCVHGNSLTQQQQFKLHQELMTYIQHDKYGFKKSRTVKKPTDDVPFEIETSSKARKWLERQIHLLQVCPSAAFDEEKMLQWCGIIKDRHRDIAHVHLLEVVNHVRNRNPYKAQEALRKFFDYSVFRPNTGDLLFTHSQVKRIGVTDQKAFRYGPLLAARIHRLFGDKQMARALLRECIREAHSNLDKTCMILVMVELSALEGTPLSRSAREQIRADRVPNNGEPPITCHDVIRLLEKEPIGDKQVEFRDLGDDDAHAFQNQLADASQLSSAIIAAKQGQFLKIPELLRDAMHSTSADDLMAKSRLISDAATALLTGLRLQQGYVDSARSTATAMVECNTSDGVAPHHETEAHAIAHVNIIYSHAIQGRWDKALDLVAKLEERFPHSKYWQCSQHVLLAKSLIHFDNAFRLAKFKECELQLKHMEAFSHEEHVLRSCQLLAQRGRFQAAVEKLSSELEWAEKEGSFTFQARLRMQLEVIQQQVKKTDPSRSALFSLRDQAYKNGMDLLGAMIHRRIGILYILNERYEEAQLEFTTCEGKLRNVGSPLELALFYLSWGYCKKLALQGPEDMLAIARKFCWDAGQPILEKFCMKWTSEWYRLEALWIRNVQLSDDACGQFCDIDDAFPGYLDWTIM